MLKTIVRNAQAKFSKIIKNMIFSGNSENSFVLNVYIVFEILLVSESYLIVIFEFDIKLKDEGIEFRL